MSDESIVQLEMYWYEKGRTDAALECVGIASTFIESYIVDEIRRRFGLTVEAATSPGIVRENGAKPQ